MKSFDSMRRDFLRTGSFGMAAAAIPTVSFAGSLQDAGAAAAAPSLGMFDVSKYGAAGDGKTLDTDAVNRAIEAAAGAGGGVVVFPAGTYLCFSIRLKSQVHLHLEQGSTIVAADSPLPGDTTGYHGGVYDAAEPNTAWNAYQDYGHNHWHNSLLWGEDIHDLSITGPGLIWERGSASARDALPAATTLSTGPSRWAWAIRALRSKIAVTLCYATSRFSRAVTSVCC